MGEVSTQSWQEKFGWSSLADQIQEKELMQWVNHFISQQQNLTQLFHQEVLKHLRKSTICEVQTSEPKTETMCDICTHKLLLSQLPFYNQPSPLPSPPINNCIWIKGTTFMLILSSSACIHVGETHKWSVLVVTSCVLSKSCKVMKKMDSAFVLF